MYYPILQCIRIDVSGLRLTHRNSKRNFYNLYDHCEIWSRFWPVLQARWTNKYDAGIICVWSSITQHALFWIHTYMNVLRKKCEIWGKTHCGEKRIWSSRGRGVNGDGVWVGWGLSGNFWEIPGNFREISWKSLRGSIIKIGVVKKEIKFLQSDCGEIILRSWWIHPLNISKDV